MNKNDPNEKINKIRDCELTHTEFTYRSFIIPKYIDFKMYAYSYENKQTMDATLEEAILYFLEFSR